MNSLGPRLRGDQNLHVGERGFQRHIGDVELDAPRLQLGEVEHIVNEPEQVVLRAFDLTQVLDLLLRDGAADAELDQLRITADGVQRGA